MDRGLDWDRLSLIYLLLGRFFHLRGVIIDHSLAIVTMESSMAGKQRWKVARNLVETSTLCCFSFSDRSFEPILWTSSQSSSPGGLTTWMVEQTSHG
jgi:hypothetical protein